MSGRLFMLDTNVASFVIKKKMPRLRVHLESVSEDSLCLSIVTKAELLFGVALKPEATSLKTEVLSFLLEIDVLDWNNSAAEAYAKLQAFLQPRGIVLGDLDLLIAAHALAVNAVLVTN